MFESGELAELLEVEQPETSGKQPGAGEGPPLQIET
jgi:hypothetical protein